MKMKDGRSFLLMLLLMLSPGLACVSQSSWTPAVDKANDPKANTLAQDEAECRQLAKTGAASTKQAAEGAAEGAAVGAVAGAVIGAMVGAPGVGAEIGAAGGATSTGTTMARDSNADFKTIFSNCLKERGHPVLN